MERPIVNCMDTVEIGLSGVRHLPVRIDKHAAAADGILPTASSPTPPSAVSTRAA